MTMTAAGVAKLIEECGELQQVLGKRLAMWDQPEHWDGTNLNDRLIEEMGDVKAAIWFVANQLGLDQKAIHERVRSKIAVFASWHEQIDNNDHGIDGRVVSQELWAALLYWRREGTNLGPMFDTDNAIYQLKQALRAEQQRVPT